MLDQKNFEHINTDHSPNLQISVFGSFPLITGPFNEMFLENSDPSFHCGLATAPAPGFTSS